MEEVDEIAEKIHECFVAPDNFEPTPIVKITEAFGIPVYRTKNINVKHSGNIHIVDDKCEKVGKEKIILVDAEDVLPQQRFVIAHELGHYLFDYIGSDFQRYNQPFTCPYLKDNHEGKNEKIANRFATSLLMPAQLFIKEHNNAVDTDDRKIYVIKYLSRLFQVKEDSIIKRIKEVKVNEREKAC